MKQSIMRFICMVFAVVLAVSTFVGTLTLPASAKVGELSANNGTRHETCTALSEQALSYYTGNYTWENLSSLSGGTQSCLDMDSALFQALHELMDSTMTESVTYTSLKTYYAKTDATSNSTGYILFYSDALSDTTSNGNIAREHVWAKSHASFYEKNGGADLHHLRPANQYVNAARSNLIFGNVRSNNDTYSVYPKEGTPALYKTSTHVEINDNIKGDVARILLYVWCRWEQPNLFEDISNPTVDTADGGKSNTNDGSRVIESLETLLQWCYDDPVDTWEMSRNDQVENVQGNRNVFIDYPEFAWLVFGLDVPEGISTPSQLGDGSSSGSTTVTPEPDPSEEPIDWSALLSDPFSLLVLLIIALVIVLIMLLFARNSRPKKRKKRRRTRRK